MKKTKPAFQLFYLLMLINVVGYVGDSFLTADRMNWYETLALPYWLSNPHVFFGVWTVLSVPMAFAALRTWGRVTPRFFVLNLATYMAWSIAFFYFRSLPWTVGLLAAQTFCLLRAVHQFWKEDKIAAILLLPNAVWALTITVLMLVILI